MGLFDKLKKDSGPHVMSVKSYCFVKKDEELIELLHCDPKFDLSTKELLEKGYADKRVYRFYSDYKADEITLEPEPKNPVDKNAVKIILDGKFFGYVNKDDAPKIKQLLKKGIITDLHLHNHGGPVRKIFSNGKCTADRYEFDTSLTITYE